MKSSTSANTCGRRNLRSSGVNVREMCIFAMLGAVMFASKVIMEALPNIHLLGLLTVTYTLCYRTKALIPLYVYVMLEGLFGGFGFWWMPYLYIWTILWAITMLLPRRMPRRLACAVYSAVCAFHGFAFGILYSPAQALMFGLNFKQTVAWIIAGLPYDFIHGVSNLGFGLLALPLSEVLRKLSRRRV